MAPYKIELEFEHMEDLEFFSQTLITAANNHYYKFRIKDSFKYLCVLADDVYAQMLEHKRNIASSQEQKID